MYKAPSEAVERPVRPREDADTAFALGLQSMLKSVDMCIQYVWWWW